MRSTLSCPPHPSPGQRHVLAAAGFSGHSLWRFRRIARFGSKRVAAPSFETSASLTPNVSSSRRASYCKSTKARKVRLLFDLSPERRTARAILAEGPLHHHAQEPLLGTFAAGVLSLLEYPRATQVSRLPS